MIINEGWNGQLIFFEKLKNTLQNYESQKRKLEDEVKFYKANYKELFKKEYIYKEY